MGIKNNYRANKKAIKDHEDLIRLAAKVWELSRFINTTLSDGSLKEDELGNEDIPRTLKELEKDSGALPGMLVQTAGSYNSYSENFVDSLDRSVKDTHILLFKMRDALDSLDYAKDLDSKNNVEGTAEAFRKDVYGKMKLLYTDISSKLKDVETPGTYQNGDPEEPEEVSQDHVEEEYKEESAELREAHLYDNALDREIRLIRREKADRKQEITEEQIQQNIENSEENGAFFDPKAVSVVPDQANVQKLYDQMTPLLETYQKALKSYKDWRVRVDGLKFQNIFVYFERLQKAHEDLGDILTLYGRENAANDEVVSAFRKFDENNYSLNILEIPEPEDIKNNLGPLLGLRSALQGFKNLKNATDQLSRGMRKAIVLDTAKKDNDNRNNNLRQPALVESQNQPIEARQEAKETRRFTYEAVEDIYEVRHQLKDFYSSVVYSLETDEKTNKILKMTDAWTVKFPIEKALLKCETILSLIRSEEKDDREQLVQEYDSLDVELSAFLQLKGTVEQEIAKLSKSGDPDRNSAIDKVSIIYKNEEISQSKLKIMQKRNEIAEKAGIDVKPILAAKNNKEINTDKDPQVDSGTDIDIRMNGEQIRNEEDDFYYGGWQDEEEDEGIFSGYRWGDQDEDSPFMTGINTDKVSQDNSGKDINISMNGEQIHIEEDDGLFSGYRVGNQNGDSPFMTEINTDKVPQVDSGKDIDIGKNDEQVRHEEGDDIDLQVNGVRQAHGQENYITSDSPVYIKYNPYLKEFKRLVNEMKATDPFYSKGSSSYQAFRNSLDKWVQVLERSDPTYFDSNFKQVMENVEKLANSYREQHKGKPLVDRQAKRLKIMNRFDQLKRRHDSKIEHPVGDYEHKLAEKLLHASLIGHREDPKKYNTLIDPEKFDAELNVFKQSRMFKDQILPLYQNDLANAVRTNGQKLLVNTKKSLQNSNRGKEKETDLLKDVGESQQASDSVISI